MDVIAMPDCIGKKKKKKAQTPSPRFTFKYHKQSHILKHENKGSGIKEEKDTEEERRAEERSVI